MIIDTVELFLEKYNLLRPKNNIIVAFSGGYDSMCLLDVMKKLAPKYDLNLFAIHLNHNWRGQESDLEENVCKEFCSGITFYSEKLLPDIPHTETAAREARYRFFEKCAKKFSSNAILTAHNANDNAETVFYRLLKGTGITGLEGIRENRRIYYRPLLSIYRDEIEKYCIEHDLKPNNDSSNTDTRFVRNKIRHEIFPKFPDIVQNLNKLAQSAQFANQIIENQIKKLEKYSTNEFCGLDKYLQSAAVHKFFRENNLDYDKKKIDKIVNFINANKDSKSGKTISLTEEKWLFTNNKKIKIVIKQEKILPEIKIDLEGKYPFGDLIFEIEKTNHSPEKFPAESELTAYVKLGKIDFTLRGRKKGDTIRPLGLNGTQKLKKYLNEKKIPKHEKDNIVLLCCKNEVLWAAGLGINDKIKVVSKPTHMIRLRKEE